MTIYDIAREAGVSIATVSRVLNGGKVGDATRARVQEVLDRCDYQPSQLAQGLATRQSRCVAVMTVDIRDVHHAAIAYEIEHTMSAAGYSTILCNLGGSPARAAEYLRTLNAQQIIGVFFVGSVFAAPPYPAYIQKYLPEIPILFANAVLPLPNAYGVIAREEEGFCQAVLQLARAGRRHIAFVNDDDTVSEHYKLAGYSRAMQECALPEHRFRAERSIEGGRFVTARILQQHPATDAIVFTEDTTAIGGLHALQALGRSVPGDVAVIGCNNSVYCTICSPPLTSLDNALHETGHTAARQMIRLLNREKDVEKIVHLPCRLIQRDTTPPLPYDSEK